LFYLSRTNRQALRIEPSISCYPLKEVFVSCACSEEGGWGWKTSPWSEAPWPTCMCLTVPGSAPARSRLQSRLC